MTEESAREIAELADRGANLARECEDAFSLIAHQLNDIYEMFGFYADLGEFPSRKKSDEEHLRTILDVLDDAEEKLTNLEQWMEELGGIIGRIRSKVKSILGEPLSGLTPEERESLRKLLKGLIERRK